jgi:dTDP-4-dehydrorhamnose 3,5-epimerase
MQINELEIKGCYKIIPDPFRDMRGDFVKTFHDEIFKKAGIEFAIKEEFVSISHKNVLRGMHFQLPPSAHNKLVYCLNGEVCDFIVDLRKSFDTYGKHLLINLSAENRTILYLPIGIAHGFISLTDNSIMVYKTDNVHSVEYDSGILWDSCGFNFPVYDPVISVKDRSFVALDKFESPFI